jgi:hypothetical protein
MTDLIRPPFIRWLEALHQDELEEPVEARLFSLYGSSAHAVLERACGPEDFAEERVFLEVEGVRVSGKFDLLEADGTLNDFKLTSVYSMKEARRGEKLEWVQ